MRIHVRLARGLILGGLALTRLVYADSSLSIHAQLKQPKSATCKFDVFDGFGAYLAMAHGDVVVGEHYIQGSPAASTSPKGAGCTVVFAPDGNDGWILKQMLDTSGPIAVSGGRMLVGLSLYIHDGNVWQTEPMLALPGSPDEALAEEETASVALDDSTAAIGVKGAVYVYTLDAAGRPSAAMTLTASTPIAHDDFGYAIALAGGVLAVRSLSSLYIFEHKTSGQWLQVKQIHLADCDCLSDAHVSAPIAMLDADTLAYADLAHKVRLLKRTGAGQWLPQINLTIPGFEPVYLASDRNGRFAVGSPNDAEVDPHGGTGAVDTYAVKDQISVQGSLENPRHALWFGGPLALDATHLLVTEAPCQDGIPCSPFTVDVVETDAPTASSGAADMKNSDGSGSDGWTCLILLGSLLLMRRRG